MKAAQTLWTKRIVGKSTIFSTFLTLLLGVGAAAQTVTGSGTSGTVPVFTGSGTSSAVGNSPISVSSGNVGIGTTSPGNPLTVVGSNNPEQLEIHSTSTGGHDWAIGSFGTQTGFNSGGLGFGDYTSGAWRMYIDASGKVGIGTASPALPFEVTSIQGPYQGSAAGVVAGAANAWAYLWTNSGADSAIIWNNANSLRFGSESSIGSGWSEFMRITGSGLVGIGTTAPHYALDVAGQVRSSSGGFIFPDGTNQTTAFPGSTSNGALTINAPINSQIVYFNGNTQTNYPVTGSGLGIARNFSAGMDEMDIWNTVNPAAEVNTGIRFLQLTGASSYTDLLFLKNNGNVGIGTTSPGATLEVNGNVKLTANSGASITFQDGTTQTTAYTGVSCGGDFAESVTVTGVRQHYEPGDLLVIDPRHPGEFEQAAQPYSTLIAGIYSTKPGYVGRRLTGPKGPDEVPLAMVGIVPVKVSTENGPIQIGDLLVASSTPGRAMKGTDRNRLTGAVVGKALGSIDSGTGTIEALVTLQ